MTVLDQTGVNDEGWTRSFVQLVCLFTFLFVQVWHLLFPTSPKYWQEVYIMNISCEIKDEKDGASTTESNRRGQGRLSSCWWSPPPPHVWFCSFGPWGHRRANAFWLRMAAGVSHDHKLRSQTGSKDVLGLNRLTSPLTVRPHTRVASSALVLLRQNVLSRRQETLGCFHRHSLRHWEGSLLGNFHVSALSKLFLRFIDS